MLYAMLQLPQSSWYDMESWRCGSVYSEIQTCMRAALLTQEGNTTVRLYIYISCFCFNCLLLGEGGQRTEKRERAMKQNMVMGINNWKLLEKLNAITLSFSKMPSLFFFSCLARNIVKGNLGLFVSWFSMIFQVTRWFYSWLPLWFRLWKRLQNPGS